jgi:hypothetical protein
VDSLTRLAEARDSIDAGTATSARAPEPVRQQQQQQPAVSRPQQQPAVSRPQQQPAVSRQQQQPIAIPKGLYSDRDISMIQQMSQPDFVEVYEALRVVRADEQRTNEERTIANKNIAVLRKDIDRRRNAGVWTE